MLFKTCALQIQIQVFFFWVCLYWIRLWIMKGIQVESNVLMSMNLLSIILYSIFWEVGGLSK